MKTNILVWIGLLLMSTAPKAALAAVNVQVNPDGSRYASVLFNGSSTRKYDIVFVGDGFTSSAADQSKFNNAVNAAVRAMQNKAPYRENMCAFNVWRVNVISAQSGIDHPLSGVARNTELNCSFGNDIDKPARVIYSTTPQLVTEAANFAPAHDAIYVLANDEEYGGAAGDIVYTSLNDSMAEVIVHELGHFVGRLADEYTCYFCDGRMEPTYSGPEPAQVNITKETNRNLIKWRSLIAGGTAIPTTVNSPVGVVGLWEGGGYSATGLFRPQKDCLMRALNLELCTVCKNSLGNLLRPYCTACERDPRSTACLLSRLRDRFAISRKSWELKIPECCFCPLQIDRRSLVEIELTLNPREYILQMSDGSQEPVQAKVNTTNGGVRISYEERPNVSYFLSITPISQNSQQVEVRAKLSRNGQQAVLF